MPTPEETQAKSDATRLKNLLARKASKQKLSKGNEAILKTLKAKAAKAKPSKKEKRDFSQIAWDVVQQATDAKPKVRN